MALSQVQKEQAFRSALGHIADNEGQSDREIQQKISARLGITSPADRGQIANQVRSARAAFNSAEDEEHAADHERPFRPTARDPTLQDSIADYRYRVLVRVTEVDTNDEFSNLVLIDSTIPLSVNEIHARALAAYTTLRGPNREYVNRNDVSASAAVEVEVVSGGRR